MLYSLVLKQTWVHVVTGYDADMALRFALYSLWPERYITQSSNGGFTTGYPYP